MKGNFSSVFAATAACMLSQSSAFSPLKTYPVRQRSMSLFVTRDEFLQPHFEEATLSNSAAVTVDENENTTYDFDWSRMVECAESTVGGCSIDEMEQMMKELQSYLAESTPESAAHSATQATTPQQRATIYKALESQVKLAEAHLEWKAQSSEIGPAEGTVGSGHTEQKRDIHDLLQQMREIAEQEMH